MIHDTSRRGDGQARSATCPVAGCGYAERAPRYPSDITDAEWDVLGPQARAVMAELRHGPGGRPMTHRLWVVDAIRYLDSGTSHCRRVRRILHAVAVVPAV